MATVNNRLNQSTLHNSLPAIPIKLSGTNYYMWRNILKPLLDTYNPIGYIEGTIPPPQLPQTITNKNGEEEIVTPNPEYQRWRNYDKISLICILVNVRTEIWLQLIGV